MEHALTQLEREMARDGKREQFDILKAWLVGDVASLSQAQAAQALGLTEGAVKVAIHRLRGRLRDCVKSEIAQTVSGPAAIQE
jgi:hypothetical protein